MKKNLLLVVAFACFLANGQNKLDSIFLVPSIEATYTGGDSAYFSFIKNNLKLNNLIAENFNSTAYVQFVVEKSGVLNDLKMRKGISQAVDDEILKMIKLMPNWIPAQHEGKIVRSQVILPIRVKSVASIVIIDTTYVDKNWKKTIVDSAAYYRIRKINGPKYNILYYLINGTLIEQGEYSSISPEKKNGSFVAYFDNGVKSSEYMMVNDTIQGEAVDYYPNGTIKKKMFFANGKLNGNVFKYSSKGELKSIEKFEDHWLNGVSVYYYNGNDSGYVEREYANGTFVNSVDKQFGKKQKKQGENDSIVIVFDPQFPGEEALIHFMGINLKYPASARENGIEGIVFLEFEVEIDGTVTNPIIKRDIGYGTGNAVLMLVKMMPTWIPAKGINGESLKTTFTMPVTFALR